VIVGSKIIDLFEQRDLDGIKQLVHTAEEVGLQVTLIRRIN
jgi:tryptophan synthase alpha chain